MEKERNKRKWITIRATESETLFYDIWYKGKRDKIYSGFPDMPENRERCERLAKLMRPRSS